MKRLKLVFIVLFLLNYQLSHANQAIGGQITWKCDGGSNFIFELVLFRDCNGPDFTVTPETIKVWNHSVITAIQLDFVSRSNISPGCDPVPGSPPKLLCGTGANGGNGTGSVERLVFNSLPISLSGIPPPEGWVFTYETTSRSSTVTNIINPSASGMAITAIMYKISSQQTNCMDSSPQFYKNPNSIVCTGTTYQFLPGVQDPDLDSIRYSLVPLQNSFSPLNYNPPTSPGTVSYQAGYSALSPTPGQTINAGNTDFTIDPQSGEMIFSSIVPGEFVLKYRIESYRNGGRIAMVEREMTIYVVNCSGTNNPPTVTSDLINFELTATAGTFINFNVFSSDSDLLQDNSLQENDIWTTSIMIGQDELSPLGCDLGPCATLNGTQPINGTGGATVNVQWATDCSLLRNKYGNEFDTATYEFVFRVKDNYCSVPSYTYQTVTIHLTTDVTVPPTQINCIETQANGDLLLSWNQVPDPNANFTGYDIYTTNNNLVATVSNINTNSATVSGLSGINEFYIKTVSGTPCPIGVSSDTIKNIDLNILNNSASDGTAILVWNSPFSSSVTSFNNPYEIYKENPQGSGNWSLIATVPFGTTHFTDTIVGCSEFLSYQVKLPDANCTHTSSIEAGFFVDLLSPSAPVLTSVTIDTLTGLVTITWLPVPEPDTYGYIIYVPNLLTGNLDSLTTMLGQNNTSITFFMPVANGPLTFSVAAIDSCGTANKTSPKSELHTSVFLQHEYDVCSHSVNLNWSAYTGWEGTTDYEIFGKTGIGPFVSFGSTQDLDFDLVLQEFQNYTFVVQATDSTLSYRSFSNPVSFYSNSTSKPSFNYTRLATVLNEQIYINHYIEQLSGISEIALERENSSGVFEEIDRQPLTSSNLQFIDPDVNVSEQSYTYQLRIIDSCGNQGTVANPVTTILLKVITDNLRMKNFLSWSPYKGFNGSILYYNIYRGVEGNYANTPFASVSPTHLFYEDTLIEDMNFNGKICYYVEAVESFNVFGFQEISRSNEICPVYEPLIYIPNTFTPNGDEFNQVFKPVISLRESSFYQLTIFDRWGQVIFQSQDIDEGWIGDIAASSKPAPSGTYTFVLQFKDGNDQEIIKRGHVTLSR